MKYYIYTLNCPISGEIKYVGKTNNLSKTYWRHCNDKQKTYKTNWINSLKLKDLKPIIEQLDESDSQIIAYKLEQYWIAQLKAWGFKLTNLTDGGNGNFGKKLSKEEKDNLSNILKQKYVNYIHPRKGFKMSKKQKEHLSKVSHLNKLKKLPNNRKKKVFIYKNNILIDEQNSLTEFCFKYNVSYPCASQAVLGKQFQTKGYRLSYSPLFQEKPV